MPKLIAKNGFSLIEVLIFVTIVTAFFVVAVGLTSQSLQQMKSSENRLIAGYLSQEVLEWLRGEKETNWSGQFLPRAPSTTPTTYCFNTSPINTAWPGAGACGSFNLQNTFKREVLLTRQAITSPIQPGQSQVNVTIRMTWQEGGRTQTAIQRTIFNALE